MSGLVPCNKKPSLISLLTLKSRDNTRENPLTECDGQNMSKLFKTRRQTKYKPMFTIINFGSRVWVLDNFLMWTLCEGGLNMCNVQSVKCDRRIMTAEAAGATKKLPKICSRAWNCDPYFLPISLTRLSFKVTFISFMSRATGRGSCCVACASSSRIVTLGIEDIRFFLSSLRFDDSWRATMARWHQQKCRFVCRGQDVSNEDLG